MISDRESRYREKCKRLQIDLYLCDHDILAHLEHQESVAAYIKALIRADMARAGE